MTVAPAAATTNEPSVPQVTPITVPNITIPQITNPPEQAAPVVPRQDDTPAVQEAIRWESPQAPADPGELPESPHMISPPPTATPAVSAPGIDIQNRPGLAVPTLNTEELFERARKIREQADASIKAAQEAEAEATSARLRKEARDEADRTIAEAQARMNAELEVERKAQAEQAAAAQARLAAEAQEISAERNRLDSEMAEHAASIKEGEAALTARQASIEDQWSAMIAHINEDREAVKADRGAVDADRANMTQEESAARQRVADAQAAAEFALRDQQVAAQQEIERQAKEAEERAASMIAQTLDSLSALMEHRKKAEGDLEGLLAKIEGLQADAARIEAERGAFADRRLETRAALVSAKTELAEPAIPADNVEAVANAITSIDGMRQRDENSMRTIAQQMVALQAAEEASRKAVETAQAQLGAAEQAEIARREAAAAADDIYAQAQRVRAEAEASIPEESESTAQIRLLRAQEGEADARKTLAHAYADDASLDSSLARVLVSAETRQHGIEQARLGHIDEMRSLLTSRVEVHSTQSDALRRRIEAAEEKERARAEQEASVIANAKQAEDERMARIEQAAAERAATRLAQNAADASARDAERKVQDAADASARDAERKVQDAADAFTRDAQEAQDARDASARDAYHEAQDTAEVEGRKTQNAYETAAQAPEIPVQVRPLPDHEPSMGSLSDAVEQADGSFVRIRPATSAEMTAGLDADKGISQQIDDILSRNPSMSGDHAMVPYEQNVPRNVAGGEVGWLTAIAVALIICGIILAVVFLGPIIGPSITWIMGHPDQAWRNLLHLFGF